MTLNLTRQEGLDDVADASIEYVGTQLAERGAHQKLKRAIKRAKEEANLTQQEIADATVVSLDDGEEFRLSRQRISQIIHEEE
jgi:hypothetical protein